MKAFINIYRLSGDGPSTLIKRIELDASKSELFTVLNAVRSALPKDCGASITDTKGNNVYKKL